MYHLVDYKKAYDSVAHTWILECIGLYKINRDSRHFIRNSMGTTPKANFKPTSQVGIKCGIYQGRTLLFCICMNPLSEVINMMYTLYTPARFTSYTVSICRLWC